MKCPKCDLEMVIGLSYFAFTMGSSYSLDYMRLHWVEGTAEVLDKRKWSGDLKAPQLPIKAHRCPGCGLIEFYAKESK